MPLFSFASISAANKLGVGGFGLVYKVYSLISLNAILRIGNYNLPVNTLPG